MAAASVFFAPRGRHSEKPAIVREAIEKMYPDFDASTRLELFAESSTKGGPAMVLRHKTRLSREMLDCAAPVLGPFPLIYGEPVLLQRAPTSISARRAPVH